MSNLSIWKFPIRVTDKQFLLVPRGATPLHVDVQNGTICIWALVDPFVDTGNYIVRIYGTGHPFDGELEQAHVGSVQQGPAVWHVFWEAPR